MLGRDSLKVAEKSYYRVPANLYQDGDIIREDLFFFDTTKYILYRPKHLPWTAGDRLLLEQADIRELFIQCDNRDSHLQFLEDHLGRIIEEPLLEADAKAQILYNTSKSLVSQIFHQPKMSDNIRRSVGIIRFSIDYISHDLQNLSRLMKLATDDFSEYTHAVHVGYYAIRLAHARGIREFNKISALGVGALLHDIGKLKIDRNILEKPDSLTNDEKKELEKHAGYGYELVHDTHNVPELSERLILQHHERPDGSGYPEGLQGGEMEPLAEILSISDEYDTMIRNHPYQHALNSEDAIDVIRSRFSEDLVEHLICILKE